MKRGFLLASLLLGLVPSAAAEAAADVSFGPNDVRSVAFIAKSENKNEVHYSVSLDGACKPANGAPIRPYWRQRERGENATEPLLSYEHRAYGVKNQRVEGFKIFAKFAALERDLVIETWKGANGCEARALTSIDKQPAKLHSVYAKLAFPFRVEYLLIQGYAVSDGHLVKEHVEN